MAFSTVTKYGCVDNGIRSIEMYTILFHLISETNSILTHLADKSKVNTPCQKMNAYREDRMIRNRNEKYVINVR